MKKSFIAIIFMLNFVCFAQSPFSITISKDKISICSGGAEFFMNAAKKSSVINIEGHGSITTISWMPQPLPKKLCSFSLGAVDEIKILQDSATIKRLKIPLIYTGKLDNVKFYAILEAHKDIPALIIDYQIDNERSDNLYFRYFLNMVIPSGGVASYMLDYDGSIKFPVTQKKAYLPKAQWQLAIGPTGKGIGFSTLSKNRPFTFKHPRYARANYLGIRNNFGLKAKSSGVASRLIVFPANTHKEAAAIYNQAVNFKAKKKSRTVNKEGINPFRNSNVLKIKKMPKAPIIDGVLDKAWNAAVATDFFRANSGSKKLTQKTRAFIGYDNKNLYIAFVCHETDMTVKKVFKHSPWQGNAVEIFFSPEDDNNFFQIVGNISGSTYTRKVKVEGDADISKKWMPAKMSFKTKKYADKWIAEFAIPLTDLDLTSDKEGLAGINLYRSRMPHNKETVGERAAFSPTNVRCDYLVPEKFGALIFKKYPFTQEYQKRLNATRQEIENVAKHIKDKKVLAKLKPLLEKFSNLSKQVKPDMGLQQLFAQIAEAEKLKKQIYNSIYAFMPIVVWVKNPMQPLQQFALPKPGQSKENIKLAAFLNEYEYAAVGVSNMTTKLRNFQIGVSELCNIKNKKLVIDPPKIKFRQAVFVKPQNIYPVPDAMPYMNQINSFVLGSRQTSEIWLEINARKIEPGTYTGKVFIQEIIGDICKEIPLSITILPVRLPNKKPFLMHFMCSGGGAQRNLDMIKEYYGNIISGPPYPFYKSSPQSNRRDAAFISAAKKHGIKTYGAWCQKVLPEDKFQQQLKCFSKKIAYLKTQGITADDFSMRHVDEVRPQYIDAVCERIKRVKAAVPGTRFTPTLGGQSTADVARKYAEVCYGFIPYGPESTSLVNNKEIMKIMSGDKRPVHYYCNLLPQKTTRLFGVIRKTAWAIKKFRKDGLSGGGLWGFVYSGMNLHNPATNFSMVYYNFQHDKKYARTMRQAIASRRILVYRDGLDDVMGILRLESILKNDQALTGAQKQQLQLLVNEFNNILCNSNDINAIWRFREKLADTLPQILPVNATGIIRNCKITVKNNRGNVLVTYQATRQLKGLAYYENTFFPRQPYAAKLLHKTTLTPEINLYELAIGDYKFTVGGIDENGRVFIDPKKLDVIVEHTIK